MIETIKAVPGLIKDWTTNSDLVYQLVGCGAGLLTIVAYIGQQRPSETMAGLMRVAGATGVAEWFESGLPPVVAQPDTRTSHTLVVVAGLVVLILLVKPFFNARRDDWPIDLQARGILGARGACTAWMLLMLAAQFGSLTWVATWLLSQALAVVAVMAVIALIGGLLFLAASRLTLHHLMNTAGGWISQALAGMGAVVIMTLVALAYVVIGPVFSVTSWLLTTESDVCVEAKRRVARELASRRQPAGAISLPVPTASSASDLAV